MMLNPRVGQRVKAHYNPKVASAMPYHGRVGVVVISGRGRPRNHLIDFDGVLVVVPCGNVNKDET